MKTIKLFILIFSILSGLSFGQTIADLHNAYPINTPNTYYKDIGNRLDPFVGTWIHNEGGTYIKIVLVKKVKFPVWQYYEDTLIGGFQYKKDGVEKINTLNAINFPQDDPIRYPISGNRFRHTTPSTFSDYTTDNTQLELTFRENDCFSDIIVRTLILNGQPAIQIFKRKPFDMYQNCTPVIPGGFYYLKKL